ncbi:MAG: RIP metalloprotease RseP [Gammaproteobacteria bacterium]|nr:RIP metalloprotease RseP [Gammaproteobacteria bacterium]
MATVLFSIAAFIFALGILITVHEFGHYWVARKMGVKVLRFSIGFGKPLLRWVRGEDKTEYVIAALPLGGYVKMLDAREGSEIAESERHREFTQKPLYARFAIVFAGPLFNFIFAFFAYWLLFVVGISGVKPVVGGVLPDSLAARAGVEVGEQIQQIDGRPVQTWEQFSSHLIQVAVDGGNVRMSLSRSENGVPRDVVLAIPKQMDIQPALLMREVGLSPESPVYENVIDSISEGSAAQQAGLMSGDRITMIGSKQISDWLGLVEIIRDNPELPLLLTVQRGESQKILHIRVTPKRVAGEIGQLGVRPRMLSEQAWAPFLTEQRYGVVDAIGESVQRIAETSVLSLKMFGRMLIGEASLKNLSGPITIADYAGKTASIGLAEFLSFLALISISLGIINLLPIPLLDGGHLMYYVIEFVKGSPVSEQVEIFGQRIGIALLLTLMSIAFINDIARLLP